MLTIDRTTLSAGAQALILDLEALPGDAREAAWLAIGEMVHECAECAPEETIEAEVAGAADINNGDFPAQVAYLLQHNPPEFEADIRAAAGLPEATDPDLARRYGMIVTISADEPALLRRCDVARVVEAALDAALPGFPAWLAALRPDLADTIAECGCAVAG